MKSSRSSAENKKSLLAIGVLMLSLAALQSPLWRSQTTGIPIAVRSGGATLIASDRPIAQIAVNSGAQATAEVVGDHEVLIRGKALGETQLQIDSKDGHSATYRVVVQSESAKSLWRSIVSR
jgi:Flp pilus assembly secretin CpaC